MRETLANLLAPRTCVGCGIEGSWCCVTCIEHIAWDPNTICAGCERLSPNGTTCERCRPDMVFRGAIVAATYDDPNVQQLIRFVKYAPAYDIAGAFVPLITHTVHSEAGRALREALGENARIIPVPLHPRRLRERGFNQASCIAHALAEQGFGAVREDVLRRTRFGAPQARKSRDARRQSMDGVFAASPDIAGATVLLVDDVITTGVTMSAAARTLRDAGATTIHAFAIARG
ncbi:MAG: ComF family protein [bacterium]|nr:ComF family protein [bacterium]